MQRYVNGINTRIAFYKGVESDLSILVCNPPTGSRLLSHDDATGRRPYDLPITSSRLPSRILLRSMTSNQLWPEGEIGSEVSVLL